MEEAVRILLVDDDKEDYLILKEIADVLPRFRNQIDWCDNYEQAKLAIRENRYQVYLIDYRFGVYNGLEVIREAVQNGCESPMILLTGQDANWVDEEATQAGAFDYLVKGAFTAAQLERSIRYSLEQARNLARIRHLNNELEARVAQRTSDLSNAHSVLQQTHEQLQLEIRERKSAEEHLNDTRRLLQMIGQNFVNGFIALIDENLRYVHGNGQEMPALGWQPADWMGKEISHLIKPKNESCFVQQLQRVLSGENTQFEYATQDGRDYLTTAFPIHDSQGHITQALLITTNISERKQAERALRESEQRFRAIFHSTYQFTGLMQPDGTLLEVNETALTFGGLTLADVLHHKIWETHWWQTGAQVLAQLQESVLRAAQGEFIRYETEVQGADNRRIIIDFSIKPITNERGEVILLIPEGRNITEMKKAEHRIRKSEEQLKLFISQSPTAIAMLDTDLHYLAASQQWLDYYGIDPTHFLGESHYELLPEIAGRWRTVHEQCLKGKVEKREERLIRSNGKEVWMKWEARPWYDLDGQIGGLLLFTEDITSRKLAEEQIRESEEKFRTMFDLSPIGMALNDLENGQFLTFNKALLESTGYTAPELQAITFYQLTPAEYLSSDQIQLEHMRQHGTYGPYEKEFTRKDGRRLPVLLNGIVVRNRQNQELVWSFIQDISALKAKERKINGLNEKLAALNHQKDTLFSVIAHDLRSPVGNVDSLLDLMWMKLQDNEMKEAIEFLPLAKQASSNARLLLDDLLLWARNQFDKVYFQPELLSLQQIIDSVFELLKPQADTKRLQLIANCPPDLFLEADEQMLKVILRNLLSNAIKFSFPDNVVRIEVCNKEQAVEISVSDQGVGISEQNLAKLFNRHYHVSTRGTQGEKGSGLGLDLCRDFVEKHSGEISVLSKSNHGSTFIVLLPLLVKLNGAG